MSVFITSTSINIPINRDDVIKMGFHQGSYKSNYNKYYYWFQRGSRGLLIRYDFDTNELLVINDMFKFIAIVDTALAFKIAFNTISANFDDLWGNAKYDLPGFHKKLNCV